MQVFKGTIFCCVMFSGKKMLQYFLFFTSDVFSFQRHIFSFEKDPGVVKTVTHIRRSLFYQKLVNNANSD